jgi:purine-binding chemotaxis protein CheW
MLTLAHAPLANQPATRLATPPTHPSAAPSAPFGAPALAAPANAATRTRPAAHPAYLRVRLGPQEYGIAAAAIHEVRAFEAPGAMRSSAAASSGPACLLGVLNLRGRIVPIVDLRQLLGCPVAAADAFTALVVVKHGSRWVGAVVDAVGEMAPGQPGLKEIDVQGLLADPALALGS